MLTQEAIQKYLDKTVEELKVQAPKQNFRVVVNEDGGKLYAADYFRYLVLGRGPGKFPPPDAMEKFVEKHPEILQEARAKWKNISQRSLAFLIGRKIAQHGTDIYQGKRKGVDFLGAMEKNMPELLKEIARGEAYKILTFLKTDVAKRST